MIRLGSMTYDCISVRQRLLLGLDLCSVGWGGGGLGRVGLVCLSSHVPGHLMGHPQRWTALRQCSTMLLHKDL